MKSFITFGLFILSLCLCKAQVAIGSWQDYLSFANVHSVEKVNNRIYAATNVGLFSYDTEENVVEKITKLNGLSDIEITAIATSSSLNILIVGYDNGNIDLVSNNDVWNIPDLKFKELLSDKEINHIHVVNNLAYCSTTFGIIVLDLVKKEISDTYLIGDNSSYLGVNQVTTSSDSIYAATEKGILGAPLQSNLLSFYQTWRTVSSDNKEYLSLVSINDELVASGKNGNSAQIMRYANGNWENLFQLTKFVDLKQYNSQLYTISSDIIYKYDNNLSIVDSIHQYSIDGTELTTDFSSVLIDENNDRWVGDASNGLIQISNSNDIQILPDGPSSNKAYKMAASENALWVVAGINHYVDPEFHPAECSILRNNEWKHFTWQNNDFLSNAYNLNDIAIDPRNENHAFISSAHSGIFEFLNDEIVTHYIDTEKNAPIDSAYIWRLVNGVVMDGDGNLFANNMSDSIPVIVKPDLLLNTDSANHYGWYLYDYDTFGGADSDPWMWQTIVTSWGHLWSISVRNPVGLFVYDTSGTIETDSDDNYRYAGDVNNSGNSKLLLWDEDGDEIDLEPICLAEDKNGYIWVGTTSGIVVYYRPTEIFNLDKPIASRVKIPRNDGSGLADYLLENVQVNVMAVDGANRKWVGTESNGVYLISSDGTETILEFSTSNSPLLSDRILSLAINPNSGEVFMGTDKGILSYRGTAIEGKPTYSSVKAFPNPVNPNYEGLITVTGLMEDSNIRITDISGKIVYQANSTGGQIVWDGKNMYNENVRSGVYLVFATNEDGSEDMVTKIMIIR
ncbi:type IX secretion system anionic LPS delivery protein PorZ [Saccharicrinis sp. GN24d3]|uniref:type IX secretion system anionic LPS delivery protein PorZ n=1 Tax=Saccharicrinis sp. GN24d3 TaxID=3458416 RepID=UPI0040357AB9